MELASLSGLDGTQSNDASYFLYDDRTMLVILLPDGNPGFFAGNDFLKVGR